MILVLASNSPRRRELLTGMGLRFEMRPAGVEEAIESGNAPQDMVAQNSLLKARWAAERWPNDPVLAADTTVVVGEMILGKPADLADARRMLKILSGRSHTVYTGIALVFRERSLEAADCVSSRVTFKELDDECISEYFQIVNPLDKAGAYGIQEGREMIIAGYEGSFTNIMGLPVEAVEKMLKKFALFDQLRQS